jgi:protein transport protein SEC24
MDSLSANPKAIKDQIGERCVKILAGYRRHCAASTAAGQLILPETFKLYPLLALALQRSKVFSSDLNVPVDEKVHLMRLWKGMPVTASAPYLYPRLLQVDQMGDLVGKMDSRGQISLPPCIRLSIDRMESSGAYLIGTSLH